VVKWWCILSKLECPYSDWQIEVIQETLKKSHKKANPKRGKLSWDEIAAMIDRYFIHLSDDEKQLIPLPYRTIEYQAMCDGKIQRPGNKLIALSNGNYSTIEPMHLIATAHWLMSSEVAGSSLTFKNFYDAEHSSKAAQALSLFLDDVDDDTNALNYEKLKGLYERSAYVDDDTETHLVTIGGDVSDGVFSIRIEREVQEQYLSNGCFEKDDEITEKGKDDGKTSELDITHYGSIVIAPFEQIYILMYDVVEDLAQILIPIAIDEDVFSQNVQTFELLSKHEMLRLSNNANREFIRDDTQALMAGWAESNANFIHKYQRVND
jgi:hypothetical protein